MPGKHAEAAGTGDGKTSRPGAVDSRTDGDRMSAPAIGESADMTTGPVPGESQTVSFWPLMSAAFIGSFLAVLGISSINLAIPVFMEKFDAGLPVVQWTLTGFMLAMGLSAPISGYLGDRFGIKPVYALALAGYVAASFLCASAWSVEAMIAFRIAQGLCSGVIMPVAMTIIYQHVPKARQVFALSLWTLSSMLAPAFGPTAAGLLMETMDWPWIFLMNVPLGLLAILFSLKHIPHGRRRRHGKFDGLGFATALLASGCLLVAFSQAQEWGIRSWKTDTLLVAGLALLIVFVRQELRTPSPLLNLSVLRHRGFAPSLIVSIILTVSLYSGTYLTPLFLQHIQGMTPLEAGLVLLPSSLAMAVFMPITGKLYGKFGPRALIATGVALIFVGTFAMSLLEPHTSSAYVIAWMTVRNIGISLSIMPVTNIGMSAVPASASGHASSLTNWLRQGFGRLLHCAVHHAAGLPNTASCRLYGRRCRCFGVSGDDWDGRCRVHPRNQRRLSGGDGNRVADDSLPAEAKAAPQRSERRA